MNQTELALAMSYAVKKSKEGTFRGAWPTAQEVLDKSPEYVKHCENVMALRGEVIVAVETLMPKFPEQ